MVVQVVHSFELRRGHLGHLRLHALFLETVAHVYFPSEGVLGLQPNLDQVLVNVVHGGSLLWSLESVLPLLNGHHCGSALGVDLGVG